MSLKKTIRVELRSETALACYFLVATWRDAATAPLLETSEGPMAIFVDSRSDVIADVMKRLTAAQFHRGSLGESALALRGEVQSRVGAIPKEASSTAGPDTIAG